MKCKDCKYCNVFEAPPHWSKRRLIGAKSNGSYNYVTHYECKRFPEWVTVDEYHYCGEYDG